MEYSDLCYIYDCVWAGKYTDFKSFYEDTQPKMDDKDIVEICKYALTYYLKWDEDIIHDNLTDEVLKRMKLYNLVMRVYPFPTEISDDMKVKYLIGVMYPKYYSFDKNESTQEVFRRLNEGELDKPPKGFFSNSEDGREHAKICFRYLVNNYYMFKGYEEIFRFFTSTEGKRFLNSHHLKQTTNLFGTIADLVFASFEDLGMSADEREECMLYREKYKSMIYMERFMRKEKKARREERRALDNQ